MSIKDKFKEDYRYKLKCGYCGGDFTVTRWRKYCGVQCSKDANVVMTRMRYREMRRLVMKARGKTK